jgi:hypothetical protein
VYHSTLFVSDADAECRNRERCNGADRGRETDFVDKLVRSSVANDFESDGSGSLLATAVL